MRSAAENRSAPGLIFRFGDDLQSLTPLLSIWSAELNDHELDDRVHADPDLLFALRRQDFGSLAEAWHLNAVLQTAAAAFPFVPVIRAAETADDGRPENEVVTAARIKIICGRLWAEELEYERSRQLQLR